MVYDTIVSICLPPTYYLLSQLTDFHETWYTHHATEGYLNFITLITLKSIIPTWKRSNFSDVSNTSTI